MRGGGVLSGNQGEIGDMRTSKSVTVVHPDSRIRIALRSMLEAHGCAVATDFSCADLLSGKSDLRPDLILIHRSLLDQEGLEILSQLTRKWDESEIVTLPESLNSMAAAAAFAPQLLKIIDRLLKMRSTREILSV
jgi:DNA-binding NtrC family response regulator